MVKALNSAHMVKLDSTDKLQQLAQNILTSSTEGVSEAAKHEVSKVSTPYHPPAKKKEN